MMILTSETFQQISPAAFGFRLTLSVLIKTMMEVKRIKNCFGSKTESANMKEYEPGDSSRDLLIP